MRPQTKVMIFIIELVNDGVEQNPISVVPGVSADVLFSDYSNIAQIT